MTKKKNNAEPPPIFRSNLRIMISLPTDERLRLSNFARELGRPVSWVVRDACRQYIERVRPILEKFRDELASGPPQAVPLSPKGRPRKPRPSKSHNKP
jgi:hypothetical protein